MWKKKAYMFLRKGVRVFGKGVRVSINVLSPGYLICLNALPSMSVMSPAIMLSSER